MKNRFVGGVIIAMLVGLGVKVIDMRDGVDYTKFRDLEIPVYFVLHSTDTFGKSAQDIRDMHRAKGWPDGGYKDLISWQGVVIPMNEMEEITYSVAGKNTQAVAFAYLGSGQSKAWTYAFIKNTVINLNVNAEVLIDQGGTLLGVVGHRDFAKEGHGTDCPGHVAYAQAVKDGLFSHIKVNGVLIQNSYFKEGVMKDTYIYEYLYKKGLVK